MDQPSSLADLLRSFGLLMSSNAAPGGELSTLLDEWKNFFQGEATRNPSPTNNSTWEDRLARIQKLPNRQAELQLIKEASDDPVMGMTLVVAAIPYVMKRQAQSWWNQMFAEQTTGSLDIGTWKVKTLPPGDARQYLIFSDVHRDAAKDDLGDLAVGSIDHFSGNSALYLRVLDHALANAYTVVEAGDCEELWFVRKVSDDPKPDAPLNIAAKLQEIIDSHPKIYDRLRQLHRQGRYVRIQGNHDSFLKKDGADDSVGAVLRSAMQFRTKQEVREGVVEVPFEIYDGFVIDGVKTMFEHSLGDMLDAAASFAGKPSTKKEFIKSLLSGRLGLDSNDYTEKCRMLVCHGHQFDFWNCPDNEILGMLIANTVGTFIDRQMDPFLDMRGIAWQGNPLIDFGEIFAALPVFDSWPNKNAALRFAHRLQHMANGDRVLNDNLMFYESIAALYGGIGMALNYRDPGSGRDITPEQSRKTLPLSTPAGIAEYLKRHHFHHICIGHTHAPHSQPHFTLKNLGQLIPPLAPIADLLRATLPDMIEPRIKTSYFNSGTVGWMQGVIWAIEIDASGQARLVYWTENSRGPEYMDWELQPLPEDIKKGLLLGADAAFKVDAGTFKSVEQSIEDIYKKLRLRLKELNVSDQATRDAVSRATVLPMQSLALALMASPKAYADYEKRNRHWELTEIGIALRSAKTMAEDAIKAAVVALENELDKLRTFTIDVLLSFKRRVLSGFTKDGEFETFTIRAPISPEASARVRQFSDVFKAMGQGAGEAQHHAALCFSIFAQFPRSMPFFSTMAEPLQDSARLLSTEAPVLQALLSTLWIYPSTREVTVHGVKLAATFSISGRFAMLKVALGKAAEQEPVPVPAPFLVPVPRI